MSDIFTRLEKAYFTACNLDLQVQYLATALQSLHAGRFEDAHMELYLGEWTACEPPAPEFSGMVFELEAGKGKRKGRAA